jgi:hypothetical protein
VNRCLTEGRQAFARRLAGIQGGVECERFAPLLSALADGEASAEQLALLRPHMRTCLACRARLKAFRAAPRVAALVPPAALVMVGAGPLRSWLESVLGGAQQKLDAALGATQQKAALVGERAHAVAELAAGQKVAAVAASAVALAGGGTAVDQLANHRGPPQPRHHQEQRQRAKTKPVKEEVPIRAAQALAPAPAPAPQQPAQPAPDPAPAPAPAPAPPPAPPPPPPPPDPANEFVPGAAAPAAAPAAPAPPAPATPAPAQTSPGGSGSGPGGGPGEFAP